MATLMMKPEWTMSLTIPELRLVLKALGGRLKPEEIEDARKLGDHLSKLRAQTTIHVMQEAHKLLENLD